MQTLTVLIERITALILTHIQARVETLILLQQSELRDQLASHVRELEARGDTAAAEALKRFTLFSNPAGSLPLLSAKRGDDPPSRPSLLPAPAPKRRSRPKEKLPLDGSPVPGEGSGRETPASEPPP